MADFLYDGTLWNSSVSSQLYLSTWLHGGAMPRHSNNPGVGEWMTNIAASLYGKVNTMLPSL